MRQKANKEKFKHQHLQHEMSIKQEGNGDSNDGNTGRVKI